MDFEIFDFDRLYDDEAYGGPASELSEVSSELNAILGLPGSAPSKDSSYTQEAVLHSSSLSFNSAIPFAAPSQVETNMLEQPGNTLPPGISAPRSTNTLNFVQSYKRRKLNDSEMDLQIVASPRQASRYGARLQVPYSDLNPLASVHFEASKALVQDQTKKIHVHAYQLPGGTAGYSFGSLLYPSATESSFQPPPEGRESRESGWGWESTQNVASLSTSNKRAAASSPAYDFATININSDYMMIEMGAEGSPSRLIQSQETFDQYGSSSKEAQSPSRTGNPNKSSHDPALIESSESQSFSETTMSIVPSGRPFHNTGFEQVTPQALQDEDDSGQHQASNSSVVPSDSSSTPQTCFPHGFGTTLELGEGTCPAQLCGDPGRVTRKGKKDKAAMIRYRNQMYEANESCR
ncbi:hypothetical protein VTL71DRAFT_2167 [Oculimacula yallundae]|uniref:Transcription factor n=1 Tax=Oculimacula yallundae TaxID=86028 RepID=A0ABR4C9E4_9HELO